MLIDEKAPRVRHKKRGTTYEVLGHAQVQTSRPLEDYEVVTVYRSLDTGDMDDPASPMKGDIWVRPKAEFEDGRFEPLAYESAKPAPASEAVRRCEDCDGTGLRLNMAGEPDECRTCRGDTVVSTPAPAPAASGGLEAVRELGLSALPDEVSERMEREARNLANLWSNGDHAVRRAALALQLRTHVAALASPAATSIPAPAVEPVARVLDPDSWRHLDEARSTGVVPFIEAMERCVEPSLATARAVLALFAPLAAPASTKVEAEGR